MQNKCNFCEFKKGEKGVYCEELENGSCIEKEISSSDYVVLRMVIKNHNSKERKYYIQAEGDDETFLEIKHCPMCGRKLKDDSNQ